MHRKKSNGIGLVVIAIGTLGILFALGDLIVRVVATILCLGLINYGLRMQGMPPLQVLLPQMINKKWFDK